MAKRYTKIENGLIEKAIIFLVNEYTKTGFNEKPVIFHSLRVACLLTETDVSVNTVVAAVLHDLIEDSEVRLEQISKEFGIDVATLVDAVSFNPAVANKEEQYREMFERTKKVGREALIIKCADVLDNSDYYSFGNNQDSEKILLDKMSYFLSIAEAQIGTSSLFKKLEERYQELLKEYKSVYEKNN